MTCFDGNKTTKTVFFVDAKGPDIHTFVSKDTVGERSLLTPYANLLIFSNLFEVPIQIHLSDVFITTHGSLKAVVPQRLRETGVMR